MKMNFIYKIHKKNNDILSVPFIKKIDKSINFIYLPFILSTIGSVYKGPMEVIE